MLQGIKQIYRKNISPHCKGNFDTYDMVLKSCNTNYEEKELIELVIKKTELLISTINSCWDKYEYAIKDFLLEQILAEDELNIVDLGGAAGYGFFILRNYLKRMNINKKLNYTVLETPAMVYAAKKFENDNLSFIDTENYLKMKVSNQKNILIINSTLQYIPNSMNVLKLLIDLNKFQHIIIKRTPFLETNEKIIYSIQRTRLSANGIGTLKLDYDKWIYYPIIFFSFKLLIDILTEKYKCTVTKESGYIAIKGRIINFYGIHARLKD